MARANRALVLANGQFEDARIPDLASPVPDGERLAALLSREDVGGYRVAMCADGDSRHVREAAEDFFKEAGPDDLLVLFLSGHGMKDRRGRFYFVTRDTKRDRLASTAVDARFFHEQMRESRASRLIVFVDTCYSGAFTGEAGIKSVAISVDSKDFLDPGSSADPDDTGLAILTGSAGDEIAMEKGSDCGTETVQSLFTRALIEGIETGDADPEGTGWITLGRLFEHSRDVLRRQGAAQRPQQLLARLPGSVPVARNPVAARALPEDVTGKISSADAIVRASVTHDLRTIAQGADKVLARKAREALGRLAFDQMAVVSLAARQEMQQLGLLSNLGAAEGEAAQAEQAARAAEAARLKAEADALERRRVELEARERKAREDEARRAREHAEEEQRARRRLDRDAHKEQADARAPAKKKWRLWAAGAAVGGAIAFANEMGLFEPATGFSDFETYGLPDPPTAGDTVGATTGMPVELQLAAALAQIEAGLPTMTAIGLPMTGVRLEGRRLVFLLEMPGMLQPHEVPSAQAQVQQLANADCMNPGLRQLMAAGASFGYRFRSANGVTFDVMPNQC